MKTELSKKLSSLFSFENYAFAALCLYVLFPVFNLIRRLSGGVLLWDFWRNYILYIGVGFLVFLLIRNTLSNDHLTTAALEKSLRSNPSFIFLFALIFWLIISTAVTGFSYASVVGSNKSRTGLICSIIYCLIFVLALQIQSRKKTEIFLCLYLFFSAVIGSSVLIEYYFFGLKYNFCHNNFIFYNSNHISYYLLVASIVSLTAFLLTKKMYLRILSAFVFVTVFASLLISNTLGCLVAFVLGLIFSAIILAVTGRFKASLFIVLILLTAAVFLTLFFVPNSAGNTIKEKVLGNLGDLKESADALTNLSEADDTVGSGRMALWKRAIKCIGEKPIFGYGLAEMRGQLLDATNNRNNTVHNEFLEYASNHGIPALLCYLAFVISVFIRGAKNRKALTETNIISLCAAFAYLVSSFFGVTMFYTTPYLFIFLALGYYKNEI